jgi:outer membrane receptor protein involved in Fe transport
MRTLFLPFLAALLFLPLDAPAQSSPPRGTIKGKIIDAESAVALPGAHVSIVGGTAGASTDAEGLFEIPQLPVGNYSLMCSSVGYAKAVKTDVVVRSGRTTFVNVELEPSPIELADETVTAGYFADLQSRPLSTIAFSSEEIRRAPGAIGDVSRIIFGLPSLAKINDTKNSLIVRGGSPVENEFLVDDIAIPSINHFPVQGSTEGPIGILNVEMVDDVTFHSGGFPAGFGDKLSSVMEVRLREGNRDATDGQVEMSLQGFGGLVEGPLGSGNGSYLLSARRSYLDLLLGLMNDNVGLPVYTDVLAKLTYDLSASHRISVIDVLADDRVAFSQEQAVDRKLNVYPHYHYLTNTGGATWRWLWGPDGFSTTSLSHTFMKTDADFSQSRDAKLLLRNASVEQEWRLRHASHWMPDAHSSFTFGIDLAVHAVDYHQRYSDYLDALGHATPAMAVERSIDAVQTGAFLEYVWRPSAAVTVSPSVRVDHDRFTNDTRFSPRLSLTYAFDDRTSLTGSYGTYYQRIPWIIAAQKEEYRNLATPRADHYILSLNHMLTESTRFTVEAYDKEYSGFPMDPSQPSLFVFDQAVVEDLFLNHADLASRGKARSYGLEVTVQKKLAEDVYGLVSGAYYRSQYRGLDGIWYNRSYDNRFNIAVEGGYKLNAEWEFSLRWLYAGGAPFTPFDEQASRAAQKGIFDAGRINASRLPDFHSLNIRADKRFHFASSTLVTYISIWNAYGRRNVASYRWNELDNKVADETMWGMLPVFGVEYEF